MTDLLPRLTSQAARDEPIARRLRLAAAASLLLAIVCIGAASVIFCNGRLIYSLDDPYISLSLGAQIAHGHYGINAGEVSSPSSSILYPVLLAAFAWTPWYEWMPALINAAAALGTGVLLADAFWRYGIVTRRNEVLRATVLLAAICLAFNVVGLVFVGLEHSLHALTSVAVVLGLARALEGDAPQRWLPVAIILLPLWRFEGLALAGLAIAALAVSGNRLPASVAAAGIAVTMSVYINAMSGLGLPALPSSVLVKSDALREVAGASFSVGGVLASALHNASAHANDRPEVIIYLVLIVGLHPLLRACRLRWLRGQYRLSLWRESLFAAVIVGGLTAHALFGAWGWFARYEAYAVAIGAAGAVVVWHRTLAELIARGSKGLVAATVLVVVALGWSYVSATLRTPAAARAIYEQQYQMHRFAVDFYRRPVGVNDLGWVSFGNPHYVLDLWGLGSEVARIARSEHQRFWPDGLVRNRHIGLVMIYDDWFKGQIAPDWQRLAVLKSAHPIVTGSPNEVAFYATTPEAVGPAVDALQAFRRAITAGARLTILADAEHRQLSGIGGMALPSAP